MPRRKIEHHAPKKETLTLDDLTAFIADARSSGATGTEEVAAGISWGGKLNKIAVEVDVKPTSQSSAVAP